MKINVGVSNRHVHLTEETYKALFGAEYLTIKRNLTQPHQYASTKTVDVIVGNDVIKNVRIVGPFRKYNQIELLESDISDKNNLPPRRQSGDLKESFPVILKNKDKEIKLNEGLILAERHIHMNELLASSLGLKHDDLVQIYKNNTFYFTALIKVTDEAFYELHIDKDESSIYNLQSGEEMDVLVCGKSEMLK